jgi:uncharacterized protein YjbI with pentapeptide repeats
MFNQTPCAVSGCPNHAVAFRDMCYNHVEDKAAYLSEFRAYFAEHKKIARLNFACVPIEDMDIAEKQFLFVSFKNCVFKNVTFTNNILHMCFLDYAVFENCSAIGSKHTNCVFAGARMLDMLIKDSNMLQDNFNNCVIRNVSITGVDLYNSRFIGSRMENSEFGDCNLKNVDFRRSLRKEIMYKYSNYEDAFFDEKDEV